MSAELDTKGPIETSFVELDAPEHDAPLCPSCTERYDINTRLPKVLPCFHTFCGACIETLMQGDSPSFVCPACSRSLQVPNLRSKSYSLNYSLMKLLEQAHGSPIKCEIDTCPRTAKFRCVECATIMCEEDRREHLRWPKMRDHYLQPLTGDASYWIQLPLICPTHNAEMQYLCVKCDLVICPHCHAIGHSGHPMQSIDHAYATDKELIDGLTTEARKTAERYGKGIELVDTTLKEVEDTQNRLEEEIRSYFEKFREAVTAREEKVLSNLKEMISDKNKILTEQKKNLTSAQAGITTSYIQLQEVNKQNSKSRALLLRREVKMNLSYISKLKLPIDPSVTGDLSFVTDDGISSLDNVGSITDVSVSALLSSAHGKGLELCLAHQIVNFRIIARDSKGKQMDHGGENFIIEIGDTKNIEMKLIDNKDGTYDVTYTFPSDKKDECIINIYLRGKHISGSPFHVRRLKIPDPKFLARWGRTGIAEGEFRRPVKVTCDQTCVYISEYDNHRVQAFSKDDGKFLRKYGSYGSSTGQFNHPYGLAVDETYLYVADYANKRINVYNKETTECIRSWDTGGNCTGLTLADGRIYVVDQNNHRLRIFSKTGTNIGNIGRQGSGDGELNYPCDITCDELYIYVTDYSNQRVQVFAKENGGFIKRIGKSGLGDGEFSKPVGIAVDKDFIYVTESRMPRVQIFSKEGVYMTKWTGGGTLGDSRFSDLYGLAIGDSGLLYATNYSDDVIQVFQLHP